MVNVASFLLFFSFSSNVTGYYAILIAEVLSGNIYQFAVVILWVSAFFIGSFLSNFVVIFFNKKSTYLAHGFPIFLEILSLAFVGVYGNYFYQNTLIETEFLILLMLFAMGLQNGLTASISNFAVKTTHLTGATTDLAIVFSMFMHPDYRDSPAIKARAKLLIVIFAAYLSGGLIGGIAYKYIGFSLFYIACFFLLITLTYDLSKIYRVEAKRGDKLKKEDRKKDSKVKSYQNVTGHI